MSMEAKKMGDVMKYKGYTGSVEYSAEDHCLYGKVLGIKSLLLYEGDSIDELEQDFHIFVDEYLEQCESEGIPPEKPFKGSLNVRLKDGYHRELDRRARERGITINALINEMIGRGLA